MRALTIPGPRGKLEAIIGEPEQSSRKLLGIICHPHPLHEGTMNNKVVTTVGRVFERLDIVPLKFNFRGVGKSEGEYGNVVGELDDLRSVLEWAKQAYPDYGIILAGFSFGSYIATKVATEIKPVALITIAPPVHHCPFNELVAIDFPWIVVQGDDDEVVPPDEVYDWLQSLDQAPSVFKMPGVCHFFHGHLIELRDHLATWLGQVVSKS